MWRESETVVMHYVEPPGAFPAIVAVTGSLPTLHVPVGTRGLWPAVDGSLLRNAPPERRFRPPWHTIDHEWTGSDVLIIPQRHEAHSVWVMWKQPQRRFAGWYVNLEAPWRSAQDGFVTRDHVLDIWVEPDGAWRWKDEDELEVAESVGHFTPVEVAAIRAEGERVLERIEAWSSPFSDGWEDWRPNPAWTPPELPGNRDVV